MNDDLSDVARARCGTMSDHYTGVKKVGGECVFGDALDEKGTHGIPSERRLL